MTAKFSLSARLVLAMLALSAAVGCPERREKEQAVPTKCTSAFAQCQLPEGPLGVCNEVQCKAGQTPPCLKCFSQH